MSGSESRALNAVDEPMLISARRQHIIATRARELVGILYFGWTCVIVNIINGARNYILRLERGTYV